MSDAEDLHFFQGIYHHAHRARKSSKKWRIGIWNVRSMVDIEGTVAIARMVREEKKGSRLDSKGVEEAQCEMKVAGLQETK